jgi:hypothetical protein
VVIISATVNIAGRSARPTGETAPSVVPSTAAVTFEPASPAPRTEPTPVVASAPEPEAVEEPAPAAEPTSEPERTQAPGYQSTSVSYENCDAVRAAGAAPIHEGEPGYAKHLDRDGDGTGCDT